MASDTQIHAALMARVEEMAFVPELPVAYPGNRFDNTTGQYLRVNHLRNIPTAVGIDVVPMLQKRGFLQMDLYTPPTEMDYQVQADAKADKIIMFFQASPTLFMEGERLLLRKFYIGISDWDASGHWRTQILIEYLN